MSSNIKSQAIRVLAEMLVVFVGVYAAFGLESARSKRAEAARGRQMLVAMQHDFADSQQSLDDAVPSVVAVVDSFLASHEAGGMPEIGHLALSMSFRSGAWDAMMQSGGVNLLDVDFILLVEEYYRLVQTLSDRTDEGRQMSTALILPRLNDGNSVFYDPDTRRLRPSYRWYLAMLREFSDQIQLIHQKNGDLLERVNGMLNENGV